MNIYKNLGGSYKHIVELLTNPKSFFGEQTVIIEVEMAKKYEESDMAEPRDIDSFTSDQKIPSGTPIKLKAPNNNFFWIYKPYNFSFPERSEQFLQGLNHKGIKEEQLKILILLPTMQIKKLSGICIKILTEVLMKTQ